MRTTTVTYRNVMIRFDRRFSGTLPHLTEDQIWGFLRTCSDGSPRNQAPNTVKGLWRPLRAFCGGRPNAARLMMTLLLGRVSRFGSGRVRRSRWLPEDEARRLLDACVDETARGAK